MIEVINMNQADLDRLASFAQVWQRVQGNASVQEEHNENDDFIALLEGTNYAWSGYVALANACCGSTRQQLLSLAQDAKMAFQKLQVQYFLQEGDTYVAKQDVKFASYTPYVLRKLWQNATNLAKIGERMPDDGCLTYGWGFSCIKETFLQHACVLEQLLLQSFC